jgi:hypothetical protein
MDEAATTSSTAVIITPDTGSAVLVTTVTMIEFGSEIAWTGVGTVAARRPTAPPALSR